MNNEYICANCGRTELAFKSVRIETGEFVCGDCYFEAVEKLETPFFSLQQMKDLTVSDEALMKNRSYYINIMRRFILKHEKPAFQVMNDMVSLEIKEAKERFGKNWKDLTRIEENQLITILKNITLKEYFNDDTSIVELIDTYPSNEYFSSRDYIVKLKNIL